MLSAFGNMECIKGKPINKCSQSREKEQTPRIDLLDTGERQPAGLRKEFGGKSVTWPLMGSLGFLAVWGPILLGPSGKEGRRKLD